MQKSKKRSFLDFIIYFIVKVKNDDIFALGAQLAYYLMLSFFPFLIFLMTILGFSSLNSVAIIEGLRPILPESVFYLITSIVNEVLNTRSTGILGISVLLTVWTASSGFRAAIKGINKAYEIKETRSFIRRVITAIVCTFLLVLTIFGTLILLVFGEVLGRYLVEVIPFEWAIMTVWNFIRYGIIIFMMIVIFAALYRYTPCKRLSWREVFPGAIVTTLGWIVTSYGFAFYINNFSNYSQLYGSLGAVFVLMTWLYISSMIFILGVEVNAVMVNNKKLNSL